MNFKTTRGIIKVLICICVFIGSLLVFSYKYHVVTYDLPVALNQFDHTVDGIENKTVISSAKQLQVATKTSKSINKKYVGKKLLAITFDDGPHHSLTPQLLKILKKENVKATFYLLGSRAKIYKSIVKKIKADGHQIASHTTNHKDLTKLSDTNRKKEINDTIKIIKNITGKKPSTMRPPYGAYNKKVRVAAHAPVILWSVDPQDWRYRNSNTVYNHVVKYSRDGDIILLHDIHKTSVMAVRKILKRLKTKGYQFVTVDELIQARGKAVNGKVYTSLRPK